MAVKKPFRKFGKKLKEFRLFLDLNQRELAEKLDVQPLLICRYEKCLTRPQLGTLDKIVKFMKKNKFEITIEDILDI